MRLENYRNLRKLSLEGFRDLNIFIGPNNVGKSSILKAIAKLANLEIREDNFFKCRDCENIRIYLKKSNVSYGAARLEIKKNEWKNRKEPLKLKYSFDYKFAIYLWLNKHRSHLKTILSTAKEKQRLLIDDTDIPVFHDEIQRVLDQDIVDFIINDKTKEFYDHFEDIYFDLKWQEFHKRLTDSGMRKYINGSTVHLKTIKKNNIYSLELLAHNGYQHSTHISLFSELEGKIFADLGVLEIEDLRLDIYRNKLISEYILTTEYVTTSNERKLMEFLQIIADSEITDLKKEEGTKLKILENAFESSIEEQGSGVRSLICLAWDLMTTKEGSIILIDEPELGLHPSAKQKLLQLLLEEARSKQIFIATHDPSFINPVLWNEYAGISQIFIYSILDGKFIKAKLEANASPSLFAGFLPHTTSLKQAHLYVEGESDVYIFQVWLKKYLKENYPEKWFVHYNRIGIYHLGGDLWSHLLYTVPLSPYKSLVILDGDKKSEIANVCERYSSKSSFEEKHFTFCESIENLNGHISENERVIYCLKEKEIEYYLDPIYILFLLIDIPMNNKYPQDLSTINKLRDFFNVSFTNREQNEGTVTYTLNEKIIRILNDDEIIVSDKEGKSLIKVVYEDKFILDSLDDTGYNKIIFGSRIAEKTAVPEEIQNIFKSFLMNILPETL